MGWSATSRLRVLTSEKSGPRECDGWHRYGESACAGAPSAHGKGSRPRHQHFVNDRPVAAEGRGMYLRRPVSGPAAGVSTSGRQGVEPAAQQAADPRYPVQAPLVVAAVVVRGALGEQQALLLVVPKQSAGGGGAFRQLTEAHGDNLRERERPGRPSNCPVMAGCPGAVRGPTRPAASRGSRGCGRGRRPRAPAAGAAAWSTGRSRCRSVRAGCRRSHRRPPWRRSTA
jgi:hypothetical protein